MDEFERVGRILAADQKLKVHVRGAAAFAVPGEVTIPSPDVWHALGRNAVRMLHGMLDHETAHSKWTDFELFKIVKGGNARALKQRGYDAAGVKLDTLGELFNMIEDARIEAKQAEVYPGARDNLRKKNAWFWDTDSPGMPCVKTRIQTEHVIRAYMLAGCMISRGTKTVDDFAGTQVARAVVLTLPELTAAATAQDSAEALRLALSIYHKLAEGKRDEDEDGDSPSESGSGEGESEDSDEDHSGGGKGRGKNGDESSEQSDDKGEGESESDEGAGGSDDEAAKEEAGEDESEGEGDDKDDAEAKDGKDKAEASSACDPLDMEMGDGLPLSPEAQANAVVKAALDANDDPYVVFDHSFDWEVSLEGGKDSARFIERAREAVGPLAQAFEVALRAKREKRMMPGYDEGEADGSLLAAFSVGAVPVDEMWMQPVSEDDRDVAALILVDCSASMGSGVGTKSDHAQVTAAAFSLALSAVQIPNEVAAFTTVPSIGYVGHQWVREAKAEHSLRTSFEAMERALVEQEERGISPLSFARECYRGVRDNLLVPAHAILKSFNSTDLTGLRHIAGIHENLDGEAVLWAAKRLAQRPEPRRVLMVLSDGQPVGARVSDGGAGYLHRAIEEVTKAGIEVIGIGIASPSVRTFYPHHAIVDNLETLPQVAVRELISTLLASRQEQDEVVL